MARNIEKTVFLYSELSEAAQEKAREWYREASECDDFYAETVFEDAARMADFLGIDLRQTRVNNGDYRPTIYYSGFWSQGDGASFEGQYSYKKGATKLIRQHAPTDKELHSIADALQAVQKKHFYKLRAKCKQSGHYMNSGCMSVEVWHDGDGYRDIGEAEEDVRQLLRDFADWIYRQLETEYDWGNADAQVIESIEANDYEFTEDGERYV